MDTDDLIKALAADTKRPAVSLLSVWWGAASLAIALAAVLFFVTLGPRPDFATAVETPRFLFKFAVMIMLAVSAFGVARSVSRPEETWVKAAPYLAAAPVLLAIAIIVELLVLPQDNWSAKLIGTNSMACLTFIPLIGIGPLVIFL
ncbi:MAG: NrsF family protein, partial [Aestuariivirgaceae bacterium]